MKKIFKLFGVLLAFAMVVGLSSCGNIFGTDTTGLNNQGTQNNNNGNNNQQQQISGKVEHEFYLSDDKSSYIYYTDLQLFTYSCVDSKGNELVYGPDNPCYYQISFYVKNSANTKGTWTMYTRPKSSTNTLEDFTVLKGDFDGNIKEPGTVKLLIDGQVVQTLTLTRKTVQLEKSSPTTIVFTADVTTVHTAINATDAK